jgi:hypothetical protein
MYQPSDLVERRGHYIKRSLNSKPKKIQKQPICKIFMLSAFRVIIPIIMIYNYPMAFYERYAVFLDPLQDLRLIKA